MTDMRLSPFRCDGGGPGPETLLDDAVRSAADAAEEIVRLREDVLARCGDGIAACAVRMADAFRSGGRLFAFGNGSGATDAQDVAALFLNAGGDGPPLPALALAADAAVVTGLSNGRGFEAVFARQLAALGRPGDVALALSASGDSDNLIAGLREAGRRGMLTVGLAGGGGGQMADEPGLDHLFVVPSPSVHRVQEARTTIYHALWELTREAL